MTEVRRVAWPDYEGSEWSEREFLQGIAGSLELFHLAMVRFQNVVGEATGYPLAVYQRRSGRPALAGHMERSSKSCCPTIRVLSRR